MRALALATVLASAACAMLAHADDKISVIMPWTAEAEQGGFYQAQTLGIYKRFGLDVTIRQGGPQLNTATLLAGGAVDFRIGANGGTSINFAAQGVPAVSVAAIFQKEPSVLIAHPEAGLKSMADMKGKPIAVSQSVLVTWWRFLQLKFGFTDTQVRPYTFQIAPFLVDKNLIMQGYVTSEPFAIETQGGFKPQVFLLADDAGYDAYATLIDTTSAMVAQHPEVVQRFVDASIEGWYSYMDGDPAPANALIKKDNPDMSDAQITYTIARMKEHGIVDSGDAKSLGIGAMTDARWKSFFDSAVAAGLYKPDVDYRKSYTLAFVNKGHGLAMRK